MTLISRVYLFDRLFFFSFLFKLRVMMFLHIPSTRQVIFVSKLRRSVSLKGAAKATTTKKQGDTRVPTGDLSICSRMLYHWAISPWKQNAKLKAYKVTWSSLHLSRQKLGYYAWSMPLFSKRWRLFNTWFSTAENVASSSRELWEASAAGRLLLNQGRKPFQPCHLLALNA